MIAEMTLPRLGETMETGRISAWLKQPGEPFRRGETLVEVESDKTVVEMPALADGVLSEILVQAGQDADVGAVLCRYEDGRTAAPATAPPPAPVPKIDDISRDLAPVPQAAKAPGPVAQSGAVRATPLARNLARQGGVTLDGLAGSGRRGRIEAADVRARIGGEPHPPAAAMEGTDVPGGHLNRRDWDAAGASGPRIVLLHGLAGDVQSWAALAPALMRAGRRVTAIDLPGHGGTSVAGSGIDHAADVTAAFLQTLGEEPVHLVGHSLGGAVAARVARRVPGSLRAVTLIAPAGLDRAIDVEFVRGIVRVRSSGALGHLLRRLAVRPAGLTAAQLDALAAELGRGRLLALADSLVDEGGQLVDITADLRAAAMPVRIVWGVQDRIIPWTQVKEAGSRCSVHLIQDAGHVPHWDQPAEVAALLQ